MSAAAVLLAIAPTSAQTQQYQNDPPDQAARISWISGQVSVEPMGSTEWGQAYDNLTIAPGDRIYTDADGRAEIQIGQTYLRIGPNTDISLTQADESEIAFGMAQGSVHLRAFGLWQGQHFDLSTPNGNVGFEQVGDLRIDVDPNGATVFTNYGGPADITAAGDFDQPMDVNQSLQLSGVNPVYPQWLQIGSADDLDMWSQQRDRQILDSNSYQYVSQDVTGAADLSYYGDWSDDADYGDVWYPRSVSYDWAPYHNGHWIYRDPWGWVWVEAEPWGYAPFHYGRWVFLRGRWGWVPGPRHVRNVWSPALVVFAGGFPSSGISLTAWFPLGPGEPFRPWYRCSPRYINQVNITNIRASRVVVVRNTYVNITNVTYVNRDRGFAAMRRDDFANGRRGLVRVDARDMHQVRVVDRPDVNRGVFVARPVGRPVRVAGTDPTLINQRGKMVGMRPGRVEQAPPVRRVEPARPPRGREVVPPPSNSRFRPGQNGGYERTNPGAQQQNNRPDRAPVRPQGGPAQALPGYNNERPQQPGYNDNRGNDRQNQDRGNQKGNNNNRGNDRGQQPNQPPAASQPGQPEQPRQPAPVRPVGRPERPVEMPGQNRNDAPNYQQPRQNDRNQQDSQPPQENRTNQPPQRNEQQQQMRRFEQVPPQQQNERVQPRQEPRPQPPSNVYRPEPQRRQDNVQQNRNDRGNQTNDKKEEKKPKKDHGPKGRPR
ncbi:MAG: hypothetical protein KGN79_10675 [Acidobacteriota bacterium]|nr:hypothetical protein [Acidobacteriota bacterium]